MNLGLRLALSRENTGPKDFNQRQPDGRGGFVWNLKGVRLVPYRLPDVLKNSAVCVLEGEKDCDRLRAWSIPATTNPLGAGKWRPEYNPFFKGKRIVIFPDSDKSGEDHANDVARNLISVATSLRIVRLPGLPPKGDLSDWIDAGGTREALVAIMQGTKILTIEDLPAAPSPGWRSASGFSLRPLSELLAKPDTNIDYVLDGCLVAGTVSAVVAKPKVGKGTLAKNLCLAVSRGDDFLLRATKKGECIYLALEEREEDVRNDFRSMGADGTEPIFIHAAPSPAEGIAALCDLMRKRRPVLVVIDPLFRLARIRDEKGYAEAYAELGPVIDAARETGTHVLVCHHAGKQLKADAIDAPLGTTAIGGIVCTLIVLKRTQAFRTIQTVQRISADMPERVLDFNPITNRLSLGESRAKAEEDRVSTSILEHLAACQQPEDEEKICESIEAKTSVKRSALRRLFRQGKLERLGKGKCRDPYKYRIVGIPTDAQVDESEATENVAVFEEGEL